MEQGNGDETLAMAPEPVGSVDFDIYLTLALLDVYVCLTAATLAFLVVFGSFRRRCHSKFFKIMVWSSYVLSTHLIAYILGLIQSTSIYNELFAIWALFLLVVLGSADSFSAYSVEDNEQSKRYIWNMVLNFIWLALLIALYDSQSKLSLPLWLLYLVTVLKTGERVLAFKLASQAGLARNNKLTADFMGYEHELSNQEEIDPTHLKGYNYLVRGEDQEKAKVSAPRYHMRLEIKDDEVITIHKIWQCKGRLLTSRGDPDDQMKDICLSFALYKLICRRFTGHPLLECAHTKTWDLIRYGLLSKEDDYERAFKVIEKPSWQASTRIAKMIEFVCRGRLLKPWERKICQYSLLRSFNYRPSRLLYNCLTSNFLDGSRKGRKGITSSKLPAEVKKAIILSLKTNGKKLSNGKASLCRNRVANELSWACGLETNTHVIMVWHIATTLCELALSKSVSRSQGKHFRQTEHFIVATSLSKYCAYLVAFAPRFLPDNAYVSEFIFDQIVIETKDFLKECKSMEKKFEKMIESADGNIGDTLIKRGAELGNRLLNGIQNQEQRWKILADFWAEMMLFVAPSEDTAIHVEYLARGGEFVTHLWALLSHAGILDAGIPEPDSVVPEI
ncbi:hypothetical protein L1049_009878 [Liquidambar formosana]|uniref:DUF4220 domain-containing protein n=1 Tax=Liquidambar formosana TaxID=63359 RepID=A0AAP0N6I6_LIQFO